jgi:hypothetical protein
LAEKVVGEIKGYNFYKGADVAKAIRLLAEVWVSEYQPVTFEFGRESSPALYVVTPHWKTREEKFDEATRTEKIRQTTAILRTVNPDELALVSDSVIRAWWD